ncbi:hypothetical protein ACP4OV_020010 [Aristida adscensionis]
MIVGLGTTLAENMHMLSLKHTHSRVIGPKVSVWSNICCLVANSWTTFLRLENWAGSLEGSSEMMLSEVILRKLPLDLCDAFEEGYDSPVIRR